MGFAFFIALNCGVKRDHIIPERKGDIYSIQVQNQEMTIDPQTGGRITSLKLDGKDFLTGRGANADYWGSTFWPSPQKAWNGRLSPELDNLPYEATVEGNVLKMMSRVDPLTGYVFTKEFSGHADNASFKIRYTITNQSEQARQVAPWEVTRVHPHGLAFFPKGSDERWGGMAALAEDIGGITWFAYEEEKIPDRNTKFFSDGSEGWIAQVNEDVIFVKKFPDISAKEAAPSEAEVEIYANPEKTYVEIEQQGAYQELQPGGSLTWEVTWFLKRLPDEITAELGNESLVAYTRNLIK